MVKESSKETLSQDVPTGVRVFGGLEQKQRIGN